MRLLPLKLTLPVLAAGVSALLLVPGAVAGHKGSLRLAHSNTAPSATILTGNFNGGVLQILNRHTGTQAYGVAGAHTASSGTAPGVFGVSNSASASALGVLGAIESTNSGVNSAGVRGVNLGTGTTGIGVWGSHAGGGWGVLGSSRTGPGVRATTDDGNGVDASSKGLDHSAVFAHHDEAKFGYGLYATSANGVGVYGENLGGITAGVGGVSKVNAGTAIVGAHEQNGYGIGVFGRTNQACITGTSGLTAAGVIGRHLSDRSAPGDLGPTFGALGACNMGVIGTGDTGVRAQATGAGIGLRALASETDFERSLAAQFDGNVRMDGNVYIVGDLTVQGTCFHCAKRGPDQAVVLSAEALSVESGNVVTDAQGFATVRLPAYFQVSNRGFRYQLTPIGAFAQAIVWKKIAENRFIVRTDKPRVEVSWQVTGTRRGISAHAKPAAALGVYTPEGRFPPVRR